MISTLQNRNTNSVCVSNKGNKSLSTRSVIERREDLMTTTNVLVKDDGRERPHPPQHGGGGGTSGRVVFVPVGYRPTNSDVLCGRGKMSVDHSGNKKFRSMIASHLTAYLATKTRGIKSGMVEHIVRKVRESGGKFVKKDGNSGEWFDVGDKEAHKKVGHAFRDAHSESKVRDSLLGATILRHEKKCNKKPEFGVVAAAAPGGEEDKKNKSQKTTRRAIIMATACTGGAAAPGTSLKNGEDKKACSCCSTLVPLCGDHVDCNHSYHVSFSLVPPPPPLLPTNCSAKQQEKPSYLVLGRGGVPNTDYEEDTIFANTDDEDLFGEEEITFLPSLLASAFWTTGAAEDHGEHDTCTKNDPGATPLDEEGGTCMMITTTTAPPEEMMPAGFAALEKACFSDNPKEVDDYFGSLL